MAIYKYYLNEYEYSPSNTGGFTFDTVRVQESGSYQYVQEINGSVNFDNKNGAFAYIKQHTDCQKITLTVREICSEGTFVLFEGYFTNRDCEFDDDMKRVEIKPHHDSLYKCLTDNYDRNFNFLEVPEVVSSTLKTGTGLYEFTVPPGAQGFGYRALWGTAITCNGLTPLFGFSIYGRVKTTTYCQGGIPQAPAGAGWELYSDGCAATGLATWVRKPPELEDPAVCSVLFDLTVCVGVGCTPPYPAFSGPNWILIQTSATSAPPGNLSFWYDLDSIGTANIELKNGRPLTDVINYGLNKHCSLLDLQSIFLNDIVNPVTGQSPSSTEGIQVHAISDIKLPTASEPATREDVNLKDILEGYVNGRLNCFWRIDEGTRRLIIEHYNDLNNQGVIDLTAIDGGKWTALKNQYSYDNSDIPKAEEFPSLDSSVDFTGVDINFDNDCATGKKSYITDRFYSEVESIIQDPDEYPNDGLVMITPDSLSPIGTISPSGARSELGAITGEYRPNVAQGMANLHEKFWKYYRPFANGELNFVHQQFSKIKPVKKLQRITIPICCMFFFAPYSSFIGNNFTNGQLDRASFDPKSGFITLDIIY